MLGLICGLLDDLGEDRRVDKVHEDKSLEDSVRELWSLGEEFVCFGWLGDGHGFHLGQSIEELGRG